jgi:two-component system chemotaxis response regulator CheB
MPKRDIVVIGASAGGLEALTAIVRQLPASLQACLLIVQHTRANGNGVLPQILERASELPVSFAENGDPIEPGHIYVARPDCHLLVTAAGLRVARGPRENGFRPAIDPLFRTAAREFGPRVVGVILSGALSDGTFALNVIKHQGGVAIVQDPEEALIPSMPRSAMNAVDVDYVLAASRIAQTIERLSRMPTGGAGTMARTEELEPQLRSEEIQVSEMEERYGAPSALTCPDCGGALWEVEDGRVVRYQCHVGHQYASDSLEAEQRVTLDGALWTAVRVLEQHAELKLRMARRAQASGLANVSEGFAEGARDAHAQAQQIRGVLIAGGEQGSGAEAANRPARSTPRAKTGPRSQAARARRRPRKRER